MSAFVCLCRNILARICSSCMRIYLRISVCGNYFWEFSVLSPLFLIHCYFAGNTNRDCDCCLPLLLFSVYNSTFAYLLLVFVLTHICNHIDTYIHMNKPQYFPLICLFFHVHICLANRICTYPMTIHRTSPFPISAAAPSTLHLACSAIKGH